MSISEAREQRREARKLLSQGIDPGAKKKLDKVAALVADANTFGVIAKEQLEKLEKEGRAESTLSKNKWLLEDLAAPLTDRPISEIKPVEILDVLRRIEQQGNRETAHRLRGAIGTVFRLAIVTARAETDPTVFLRGALLQPDVKHRAAIIEETALGALYASIREYDGWIMTRAAMQFLMLTMVRPGEARYALKSEIDRRKATWSIPAAKMKMRRPFEIPLSKQALAVLGEVWDLTPTDIIFPSNRSYQRPLSENAFTAALRRMGYTKDEVTAHGFRSSASTILNERGYNADWIEAALAHQDENEVRRIYNNAAYFSQRVTMMQDWADLLDQFGQKEPHASRSEDSSKLQISAQRL